jgi:hypothetical protein
MASHDTPTVWSVLRRLWFPGSEKTSWTRVGVAFAILFGGVFAMESACYPWAYSVTFGPRLIGGWVGEVTPAVGGKHVIFIDLDSDIGEGEDNLTGSVWLCDASHEPRRFGLTGVTRNWRGTQFAVISHILENINGEGVQLAQSQGEWDTRDTIRLHANFWLFRIRNGGVLTTTDRSPEQVRLEDSPVTFTLARGTGVAFRDACGRLRSPP